MDYGIRGRKAIVCASSQGLGKACALALAREGVDLVVNARTRDILEATAESLRAETGVRVTADYDTFAAARRAEVPAGRFGSPDEPGRACAFLCSADAGFIVGQNLLIDGGAVNATI